jgi:hypothetical protein
MTLSAGMPDPHHLDEAQLGAGLPEVLSQVAAEQRPVIVQRGGVDFVMVVPLEYKELIQDSLARQEAERIAERLDWNQVRSRSTPPQQWFEDDEPRPF